MGIKQSKANPVPSHAEAVAQSLCRECGLCCNGTLFSHVPLAPDDELAPAPADLVILEDGQAALKQSCRYYRARLCSIYARGRPQRCAAYECKLFKRLKRGEVSLEQARAEVQQTISRVRQFKSRFRAATGVPARNLTEHFKVLTAAQGGCYSSWTEEHQTLVSEYSTLLSFLRRTFEIDSDENTPDPPH